MLNYSNMSSCCGVFRIGTSSLIKDSQGRNRQIESIVEERQEEESFKDILVKEQKRAAATAL